MSILDKLTNSDRLDHLHAAIVAEQLVAPMARVAQQPHDVRRRSRRPGRGERLLAVDARVDDHAADLGDAQSQIAIGVEQVLARTGGQHVQLRLDRLGRLGRSHFGVVEQPVAVLSARLQERTEEKKKRIIYLIGSAQMAASRGHSLQKGQIKRAAIASAHSMVAHNHLSLGEILRRQHGAANEMTS